MIRTSYVTLALLFASLLFAAPPAASAADLEAAPEAQAFGAESYRIDLTSDDLKTVEVLGAGGHRVASLGISFDPKDGTLLDFKTPDGTHLTVLWGDPEAGVAVTDRRTGEVVVLDAEWGESNDGAGIDLIERHRDALDFLGALYGDLDLRVFEGVAVNQEPSAGELGLDSTSDGIWDDDPPCFGSQQLGYGTSYTANVYLANQRAIQDANNKCTNQWCWGCCDFTRPSICRTILFVTTCTAYGKRCSQPCV